MCPTWTLSTYPDKIASLLSRLYLPSGRLVRQRRLAGYVHPDETIEEENESEPAAIGRPSNPRAIANNLGSSTFRTLSLDTYMT